MRIQGQKGSGWRVLRMEGKGYNEWQRKMKSRCILECGEENSRGCEGWKTNAVYRACSSPLTFSLSLHRSLSRAPTHTHIHIHSSFHSHVHTRLCNWNANEVQGVWARSNATVWLQWITAKTKPKRYSNSISVSFANGLIAARAIDVWQLIMGRHLRFRNMLITLNEKTCTSHLL